VWRAAGDIELHQKKKEKKKKKKKCKSIGEAKSL
jgi:hypothetical protein